MSQNVNAGHSGSPSILHLDKKIKSCYLHIAIKLEALPVSDLPPFKIAISFLDVHSLHFLRFRLQTMKKGFLSMKKLLLVVMFAFVSVLGFAQNPWNGKVVVQGFWWNYWNNNYSNSYADYLTELAPRLRDMGIDLVWVPPASKNAGTNMVGYSPFDHYDLGDKFQKGSTTTRFGTKDKYLRMIAVMKANGMGVIQDVVLNHVSDAGSANGQGGQDPEPSYSMRNESGYKTFRYASYSKPVPAASVPGNVNAENATEYWARNGRWSKNYTNFHPNMWTNTTSGNWAQGGWGPDLSYEDGRSYGPSSNATTNPAQYLDYNRTEARNWIVWMKKQTGVDGFRWDAVKHFPHYIQQDLSYNAKYNAGWASGGANMFNVGEYVGSASELDTYINDVKYSNGGSEDMMGTFDFALRGAIYGMVTGNGYFDMGSIPGQQQGNRYRTVPFVNNHDSFRPNGFNATTGEYTSWDTGNELVAHIHPDDGRIQAAYAVAMSVDGSPQIFFEDLFKMNTTTRFSHRPTSTTNLQVRDYLANLIWCHQKLNFKAGAYNVRYQAQDALVIERSGRAIIGITDNWTTGQTVTVQTNFGANRQLHDYSGANSNDIWTNGSGQATFWIPPCNGTNIRRGYTVWAPAGVTGGFAPPTNVTTQEWEMANDLGDSHASSLKQGGALPASSNALRTVGRVFNEANKTITITVYQQLTATPKNIAIQIYNASGSSILKTVTGSTATLSTTYTPTTTGYYMIKVRNNNTANPTQKVWVKVSYTAPRAVTVANYAKTDGDDLEAADEAEIPSSIELNQNYPNPFNPSTNIAFSLPSEMHVKLTIYNMLGQEVRVLANEVMPKGANMRSFDAAGMASGVYIYKLDTPSGSKSARMILTK